MVDITKDAEHIEEIAPEPQFDEKLKTTYVTPRYPKLNNNNNK